MSSHAEDRTVCSWCDDEIGTESALVCSSLLLLPVKKESKPSCSSLLQINILQVACSEEMTHWQTRKKDGLEGGRENECKKENSSWHSVAGFATEAWVKTGTKHSCWYSVSRLDWLLYNRYDFPPAFATVLLFHKTAKTVAVPTYPHALWN